MRFHFRDATMQALKKLPDNGGRIVRALAVVGFMINAALATAPRRVSAQETGVLTVSVINGNDEPVSDVRMRITGSQINTAVRTDARGIARVVLPLGRAHFVLTRIGYAQGANDVVIESETSVTFRMRLLPQRLQTMDVRENWIGIRGVVGDDSTMTPLRNVQITSMNRSITAATDSSGHFEFSLPKAERTSLSIKLDGYLSKPTIVSLDAEHHSADIVVLMQRGADPIHTKYAMVDLEHRMAWGGIGMFVADRATLSATGEQYLDDAVRRSGLAARKGVGIGGCVFVNGLPSPNTPLSTIKVAEIEFVEVWGYNREETRSLVARWPGGSCSGHKPGKNGDGPWVSVWLRR